jgi:hypothetical protein
MKLPNWKIFAQLPKINQLFPMEVELISTYLEQFAHNTPVHSIIFGLSLLLGRYPVSIRYHLINIGEYNTRSTIVYSAKLDTNADIEQEEKVTRREISSVRSELLQVFQQRATEIDDDTFTLEAMKEAMTQERLEWEQLIACSYDRQATIAINRIINDDDDTLDIVDLDGSSIPISMQKVVSNNAEEPDYYYKYEDISRGTTKHPVSLINTIDQSTVLPFRYRKEMMISPRIKAAVQLLKAKSTFGCPCKESNECTSCCCTEGVPAYDQNGKLTNEALECNSFIIYECNQSCSCPLSCSTRVLQKGSQIKMQVFKTQEKGWGVRTLQAIEKGQYLDEYIGELISDSEAERRGVHYDTVDECSYLFDVTPDPNNIYSIDSIRYCSATRWLNHSCNPNLLSRQVSVEIRDEVLPRIGFYALRDVEPGEELTFDYSYEIRNRIKCLCHSPNCKQWLM